MSRAIYDKAIYHREQQMNRKVYDRARNVLPVEPEPPVEEYWTVTGMQIADNGQGYDVETLFSIQGEPADSHVVDRDVCTATITDVSAGMVEWSVDGASIIEAGAGYQVNETFTILSEVGGSCVITITGVDDNGGITSLSVTDGGSFDQDIAGEISTYEYSGNGSGGRFTVTTYQPDPIGGILGVSITNGGTYSADISGRYAVYADAGSGGFVNITASLKSGE